MITSEVKAAPAGGLDAEALFEEARRRQRRRRLRWAAVGAAFAAVAVAFAAFGNGGAGRPASTPHLPAPSASPAPVVATAGTTWHESGPTLWSSGPGGNYAAFPTNSITCMAGAVGSARSSCYVVIQSNGFHPDGSRTDPDVALRDVPLQASIFRSDDLGATWTPLALPSDTWISSPLACPDADTCAVAGVVGAGESPGSSGRTVLLTTRDAGRSWTVHELPASAGEVMQLACSGPGHCVLAAFSSGSPTTIEGAGPDGGYRRYFPTTLFTTDDGGSTWTSTVPTHGDGRYFSAASLRCLSSATCIADGLDASIVTSDTGYIPTDVARVSLLSGDGGRTWTSISSIPDTANPSVACATNLQCLRFSGEASWLNGRLPDVSSSTDGGRTWSPVPSAGLEPSTLLACSPPLRCIAATNDGIITTIDGGQTWTAAVLPEPLTGFQAFSEGMVGSCLPDGICLMLQGMYTRSSGPPSVPSGPQPDAVRVLTNADR
jgi:photosystem II stability/assembly factor-like uncharacterized protein